MNRVLVLALATGFPSGASPRENFGNTSFSPLTKPQAEPGVLSAPAAFPPQKAKLVPRAETTQALEGSNTVFVATYDTLTSLDTNAISDELHREIMNSESSVLRTLEQPFIEGGDGDVGAKVADDAPCEQARTAVALLGNTMTTISEEKHKLYPMTYAESLSPSSSSLSLRWHERAFISPLRRGVARAAMRARRSPS